MSELAAPEFVKIDPKAIEENLIARYEELSGKKLYPAQIEHLFINLLTYAKTRAMSRIQHTGEQMLVQFSEAPIIDYLAQLVGVTRLPAQPARCTLRFQLEEPAVSDIFIPMFTRVGTEDGSITFSTDIDITIAQGSLYADVTATCSTSGQQGNDFLPGKINSSERTLDPGVSVINISTTAGGDDEETTPALRRRIELAPESYSTAGSYGAYTFHSLSVHQSIIDVVVLGHNVDARVPEGQVWLYPLTKGGLPTEELLSLIEAKVSSEKKRPINDTVIAKVPEIVEYAIDAELTLYRSADRDTTLAAAIEAITAWTIDKSAHLGGDIVPHQISQTLPVAGVYDVTLNSPSKHIVKPHEWPVCSGINVTVVGISDE